MRIAYHDPSVDPVDKQVTMSMVTAARRIGVDLVRCADERAIEACRPDFVLAVSTAAPKVADFPSYLMLRQPKSLFLENSDLMCNVLSYDGYLTIFDSLRRFIGDVSAGIRRPEQPGFAIPAPPISDIQCDWQRSDLSDTLRVIYFGSNTSCPMPLLFRALDKSEILHIHGPEEGWRPFGYASYRGPVAFNGIAPQHAYAKAGIGLALVDEPCRREDVISSRIFEISSVGAVSICPDMAWTRKWFGDSVLYFDADRPARKIAEQVQAYHAFCMANPARASDMGQAARRIFEAHFTAERMLTNAIDYHTRKVSERVQRRTAMSPAPPISVVVRCGGRSLAMVGRAIASIRRQTFGSFIIILAKYRDIDLSSITCDLTGAIVAFDEFLIDGGGRADMLWAGLRRIATPYFAVLDDDDLWFSDHMEEIFRAGRRVAADFDMAFAGRIEFDCPLSPNGVPRRAARIGRFGFREPLVSAWQIPGGVDINSFVARTELLGDALDHVPAMHTAEDTVLISIIAWRSKPVFSWRATTLYRADAADGSNWRSHPDRVEDDFSLALRVGMGWSPSWLGTGMSELVDTVRELSKHRPGTATMGAQTHRLVAGPAGRQDGGVFVGRPGVAGFVSEGPQAKLLAGRYMAVFVMTPNQPPEAAPDANRTSDDPVGAAEVVVLARDGPYLAHQTFGADDAEVVLRFTLDGVWTDAPIDLRVYAYGNRPFTVASVELHRDLEEPAALPPLPKSEAVPLDDDAATLATADAVLARTDRTPASTVVETDNQPAAPTPAHVGRDVSIGTPILRKVTVSLRRLAAITRLRDRF
jgi:hypothetical protein